MAAPRVIAVLALAASLIAGPAAADVFKWTDELGKVHFTDRLSNVPTGARSAVERIGRATPPSHRLQFSHRSSRAAQPTSRTASQRDAIAPFQREGALMKVNVRINEDLVVPFYVDSGASSVVIPERIARILDLDIGATAPRELALTPGGLTEMKVVQLASVDLNGANVTNLQALVSDRLEYGLLGGAFLRHFNYSVNNEAKTIVLEPVSTGPTDR